MNRIPSASSPKNRPDGSVSDSGSHSRCGRGIAPATIAAETTKLAAFSQSAVVAPRLATSKPPSGPPTSSDPCWMLPRIPLARSMRTPASSTTSGKRAWRAVAPGASKRAPRKTSPMSCQSSIPTVVWINGIAATAPALARSAATLVVRNPSLSTMTPPKNAASTAGRKLKKTASPVSAALPVVTRTNHGTASRATAFPTSEIASAT